MATGPILQGEKVMWIKIETVKGAEVIININLFNIVKTKNKERYGKLYVK